MCFSSIVDDINTPYDTTHGYQIFHGERHCSSWVMARPGSSEALSHSRNPVRANG